MSRDSGNGKVKDSQASRELTQLHRVRYDDEAFIKVLVTSSQPLAHFQSGVDGAPVQEFEELNEKSWVFYVPVLGATEELISVWFQGTNAHGDSAEVRYDILIYQENGPTSKPGPPRSWPSSPATGPTISRSTPTPSRWCSPNR